MNKYSEIGCFSISAVNLNGECKQQHRLCFSISIFGFLNALPIFAYTENQLSIITSIPSENVCNSWSVASDLLYNTQQCNYLGLCCYCFPKQHKWWISKWTKPILKINYRAQNFNKAVLYENTLLTECWNFWRHDTFFPGLVGACSKLIVKFILHNICQAHKLMNKKVYTKPGNGLLHLWIYAVVFMTFYWRREKRNESIQYLWKERLPT